jgi:hypothetical protein
MATETQECQDTGHEAQPMEGRRTKLIFFWKIYTSLTVLIRYADFAIFCSEFKDAEEKLGFPMANACHV